MRLASVAVLIGISLVAACGSDRAGLGGSCSTSADCGDGLQCLDDSCKPLCKVHLDCGDGFTCSEDGACLEVDSAIGDSCARELDCGPGQACQLDTADNNGDNRLSATCGAATTGSVTGSDCAIDADCRNGTCSLGTCTELCTEDSDCPLALSCVSIPRLLPNSAPLFSGCMQASGNVTVDVPVDAPFAELRIPVPSNVLSFALVSSIDVSNQLVGAATVTSPSGAVLYATPHSQAEFYANKIRYQPSQSVSTLYVPNTPDVAIETGVYRVEIGSFLAAGGTGTAIPDVRVIYKLDEAATLDLNLAFLNLRDHACTTKLDVARLDATGAQSSTEFQNTFVATLRAIFAKAGITLGTVSYRDITERPDLDSITASEVATLLELSTNTTGTTVFFTRSLDPAGVQALAGGTPGPPHMAGTAASGIVVSMDTLCYRDWAATARITAHTLGKQLGLFRNREPDGALDPISDSDSAATNLMFYGDLGGSTLSPGQQRVIRLNPGLR